MKVKNNKFWIFEHGKDIFLFDEEEEAILQMKEIISNNPGNIEEASDLQEFIITKGTYEVSPVSWKRIAFGFAKPENVKKPKKDKSDV